MYRIKKQTWLWIAVLLPATAINGQDLNYWTNQFGTRASLMGGAVVGGINDNTAIYYNPAALAFLDSSSVSINANLYRLENIRVINAAGEAKNLKVLNLGVVPLLISGKLTTKNPRLKIGYGIIVSTDFGFRGGARSTGFYPIVNSVESPGDEEFTGQTNVNADLRETKALLGMSWKLSPKLSVGLTNMIAVRSHGFTYARLGRMFLNNSSRTLIAINDLENVRYSQITYLPKVGINYLAGKWAWGATLGTPGLRLQSAASVTADVTGNQVNLFGNGRIDFSGSDAQEKLKAKFRYPFTMAVGGVFTHSKGRFAFTAEYFGRIAPYAIVTPEGSQQFLRPTALFPGQTTDKFLTVNTAAKPVLNAAVAFEKILNEKYIFSGSLRTDFSAFDDAMREVAGVKPHITTWDIYHVTAGMTRQQNKHNISVGFNLGFGADNDYPQSVNLDNPTENNFLSGKLTVAKARYFSAALLVGYTYSFNR